MEMLLHAIVCLTISYADAIYVMKLEGRVNLPMVSTSRCSYSCPKPTLSSGTRVDFTGEILTMRRNWNDGVLYNFNHEEPVEGRRQFRREFNGSQTSCSRYPDGTYSCTPQPGSYCYAHVRLGFRTRTNSMVSVQTTFRNTPPSRYSGAGTLQIYSLGTFLSAVRFELKCTGDDPCLEDNVTVISLLYRCTNHQLGF